MTSSVAALLALIDQRLPTGGHAHSSGVEQAVSEGLVTDVPTLEKYLMRRLTTAGLIAAAFSAAAVLVERDALAELDAELDARMPLPAARSASRAQGRGLVRIGSAAWSSPAATIEWSDAGERPHHSVVIGLCIRAAGLGPEAAAMASAYLCVTGPCTAAQRLLGLDPVEVAVASLALTSAIEQVAAKGAAVAYLPPRDLPAESHPLLDLLAARHSLRSDRLFAS